MWGGKTRKIDALDALLKTTVLQRDDALSNLDAEQRAHRQTARQLETAQEEAQARRLAQDALGRMVRDQQRQLDAALGLDDPRIAEGARWQNRREDKMPRPESSTPSGRLPGPRRAAGQEVTRVLADGSDIGDGWPGKAYIEAVHTALQAARVPAGGWRLRVPWEGRISLHHGDALRYTQFAGWDSVDVVWRVDRDSRPADGVYSGIGWSVITVRVDGDGETVSMTHDLLLGYRAEPDQVAAAVRVLLYGGDGGE